MATHIHRLNERVSERQITERDLELMFFPDTLDDVRERLLDAVADEIRRQDNQDDDR